MQTKTLTVELPKDDIEYGYSIRDYRGSRGLRWSWTAKYRHENLEETEHNYCVTKLGAIIAARLCILRMAWRSGLRQDNNNMSGSL